MKLFKKKYEKIDVSNEHIFYIDFAGEIKTWKVVVLENECVTYEDGVEKKHLKIMNKERAPGVLQIDIETSIYGELIPFQLENGIPFIKLEGEWVPSDTFEKAKRNAAVKMYRRQSIQETIAGVAMLLAVLIINLVTEDSGDWWILTVFGVFFISSALMRTARLHNELQAYKEVEDEEAAGKGEAEAVARVKPALEAAEEATEGE